MSFHFRPRPGDWLLSNKILEQAEDEIYRNVKPIRDFDVPYLAGYSKDGKRFYIDHKMPRGFKDGGRFFNTDIPIILHEVVEKSLLEEEHGILYELAHQIALRAEEAAVKGAGMSWTPYNSFCMQQLKRIGTRSAYPNCPKDLDLTPYLDEKDWSTLKKMSAQGKPLWDGKQKTPEGVS